MGQAYNVPSNPYQLFLPGGPISNQYSIDIPRISQRIQLKANSFPHICHCILLNPPQSHQSPMNIPNIHKIITHIHIVPLNLMIFCHLWILGHGRGSPPRNLRVPTPRGVPISAALWIYSLWPYPPALGDSMLNLEGVYSHMV